MAEISPAERPSAHPKFTKSYAIDQITDIEHLRRVAHRMWEAFSASHRQTAHTIAALYSNECGECQEALDGGRDTGCEKWEAWQRLVNDGFGSV